MPSRFMTFIREPDNVVVFLDPRRVTHIDTEYESDVRSEITHHSRKDTKLATRIHTPDGHWVTVRETPAQIVDLIDQWIHDQGQA